MKKRIIAVISLVLIFCLGISLFVSCNKNEDQGPAKISIAYQDRELTIGADGVQSMELFLTMTNQDGWDIVASSTGIVKDLEYDKEAESVIFAIDPSDSNDYRYGTITLTATKDGFDAVTWTLNIKQDIPTTTLVRFVDDMPLFPEKEGGQGSLDVFYRLAQGWEIGVQSSDWIEVELDKTNKKINYIVAPNLKSHTLSGNITLIATKEGEDPISCEIGVFQDYTNYILSKETFENRSGTRVTEYKYDEDNQVLEEKISYFDFGSQDPYQVVTSTYTYVEDGYVLEKEDNNIRISQITLTKEIYAESDTGYEIIKLRNKSDVWVNEQKETVEYTQGPNEEEITTSNIFTWKDDAWLLTSNIVSTSTNTDSGAISETTFETVTTQYTNGEFSNCKKNSCKCYF